MRVTTRLRELLAGPDLLVAPGAYDALSARLIAQAGFSLVILYDGIWHSGQCPGSTRCWLADDE